MSASPVTGVPCPSRYLDEDRCGLSTKLLWITVPAHSRAYSRIGVDLLRYRNTFRQMARPIPPIETSHWRGIASVQRRGYPLSWASRLPPDQPSHASYLMSSFGRSVMSQRGAVREWDPDKIACLGCKSSAPLLSSFQVCRKQQRRTAGLDFHR